MFEERILDAKYIDMLEGDERMIVKRSLRWVYWAGLATGITLVALAHAIVVLIMTVV